MILILTYTILGLGLYSQVEEEISFEVKMKKSGLEAFIAAPQEKSFMDHWLRFAWQTAWDSTFQSLDPKTVVDSSSHKILLTGDSMCEGLMFRFREYAAHNDHELKTVIWYSSTTIGWSQSDSLSKLIALYDPDYIFFTTGSNELFIRNIEEREQYIQDIVSEAGERKFIWIGPPNWAEDSGINDLIEKNVGTDRFFESKNLQFERAADGAHPTWSSAAVWADTISTWIMRKSRHKILLRKPVRS